MTHNNFYLYRRDGSCILCHPCFTFDADPQTDQKPVYPVLFILRSICDTGCHDISCDCRSNTEPVAGAVALVVGILAAWFGASLFQVSVACCAVVFVIELFL